MITTHPLCYCASLPGTLCDFCAGLRHATPIEIIRAQLRKRGFTGSVTQGRGTACSWVHLRGSGSHGEFSETEKQVLRHVGLPFGGNYAVIAPEDKAGWAARIIRDNLPF